MAQKAYHDPTPEVIPPAGPALDAGDKHDRVEAAEARLAMRKHLDFFNKKGMIK